MESNFFSSGYRKTILLLIIGALGIFILFFLRAFFSSILGAIIIFTLFKRLFDWFHTTKKLGRSISALFVIIISLLILVIPFIVATAMIVQHIGELRENPQLIKDLVNKINQLTGRWVKDPNFLQHRLTDAQQVVLVVFSKVLNGFVRTIISIAIMYFILYFMLTDSVNFEKIIYRFLPFTRTSTSRLAKELRNITYSNIIGQGIIAVVQATCVALSFLIIGIPDVLFFGVISAFLAFIPMVGVPVMFIGAAAFLFLSHNYLAGAGILVWGFIVIAVVENFLRLYLARRIANVHPLITVIGFLIGIPAFGIVGIVFGPLLLSYFILLVSFYQSPESIEDKESTVLKKR